MKFDTYPILKLRVLFAIINMEITINEPLSMELLCSCLTLLCHKTITMEIYYILCLKISKFHYIKLYMNLLLFGDCTVCDNAAEFLGGEDAGVLLDKP